MIFIASDVKTKKIYRKPSDLKPILRKLFISAYLNSLEPKVQFLCLVFLFFSEPIIGHDKGPKAVVNVLIQFSLSTKKIARLKERHFVRKKR